MKLEIPGLEVRLNVDRLALDLEDTYYWCDSTLGARGLCWERFLDDDIGQWEYCFANEQSRTLFALRWL